MRGIQLMLLSFLLLGTVLASAQEYVSNAERDPWEKVNRKIFTFNMKADKYVLRPIARGYQRVVPEPLDKGITNFFHNLGEAFTFVNNGLQGKGKAMARSGGRLLLNSTLGLAGLFDVATPLGLPRQKEDLDQTFAVWGLPSGPYLILPILGPSTVRDTTGLIIERNVDAAHYLFDRPTRWTLTAVEGIDKRADLLQADQIELGDRYVFFRDAYFQQRESLLKDGKVEDDFGEEDFGDFEDF